MEIDGKNKTENGIDLKNNIDESNKINILTKILF